MGTLDVQPYLVFGPGPAYKILVVECLAAREAEIGRLEQFKTVRAGDPARIVFRIIFPL